MADSTKFSLTALDHQLLAMKDEEFVPHDWNNLREIIGESKTDPESLSSPTGPELPLTSSSTNSPQHGTISDCWRGSPPICADTCNGQRRPKPNTAPS